MARRRRSSKTGSSVTQRSSAQSGNRWSRWLVIAAIVVVGVLAVCRKGLMADAQERLAMTPADGVVAQVIIDEKTGRKVVQGSVVLKSSLDRVWSVVTDYKHYSEIFPQMQNVTVERTSDGRRRLSAEVKVGPMSWAISMKINHERTEKTRIAEWDEPSGRESVNRGFWRVESLGGGTTRLTHRRDIARSPFPSFVLRAGIHSRMDDILGAVAKRLESGAK